MSLNGNIRDGLLEPKKSKSETNHNEIYNLVASPSSVLTTAPGLEPLDRIQHIYIVQRNEKFPFDIGTPTRNYFQIFDDEGQHIYSVCQTDPPFRERKFVMYVYNTTDQAAGDPVLKILLRCPERPEEVDKGEILPCRKVDGELAQLNSRRRDSKKASHYRDARAHIHIRHLQSLDHDFLGHIWRGTKEFRVYNGNLQHLFSFPKEAVLRMCSGGKRRKKISCLSDQMTFYDYFHSGKNEPCAPELALGRVEYNVAGEHVSVIGNMKPCCQASFPVELSSVEKCLILSFALSMYCRTKSTSERLHQRCLFIILGVSSVVVVIILVIGTVCELNDNAHCKVFEI